MIAAELISKVKKIEIKTRRLVDDITGGAYHSVFKGSGIEFDEVREYTESDDVRNIDWNVTARMGSPFVKKYVEERELHVMLLVDVSASSMFGSGDKSKRQHAIEVAALLALSAVRNNDRVGLLLFSDQTELYIPPRSGKKHVLRLIRELVAYEPKRSGTDIGKTLRDTLQALQKRNIIFVLSDFIDSNDFSNALSIANRRHDVVAVRILDAIEFNWPFKYRVAVEDAESGELIYTHSARTKYLDGFKSFAKKFHRKTKQLCQRSKVDIIDMRCGEDIVKPLIKFFNNRKKRR